MTTFSQYKISKINSLNSIHLGRSVTFRTIENQNEAPKYLLFLNDGQDLEALNLIDSINTNANPELLIVAIHANENRLREYGTAGIPDYKNRGDLAQKHTDFVLNELLPLILKKYKLENNPNYQFIAGFSLGGLSAIDIAINHPSVFSKVGVFSGSLWWRKKAYEDGYDDENDRIMHNIVKKKATLKGQKFWFQCGTEDEASDRNGNGIIDSIDDTQDLIVELCKKDLKINVDVQYLEIIGGKHNPETWGKAFGGFLKWLKN